MAEWPACVTLAFTPRDANALRCTANGPSPRIRQASETLSSSRGNHALNARGETVGRSHDDRGNVPPPSGTAPHTAAGCLAVPAARRQSPSYALPTPGPRQWISLALFMGEPG